MFGTKITRKLHQNLQIIYIYIRVSLRYTHYHLGLIVDRNIILYEYILIHFKCLAYSNKHHLPYYTRILEMMRILRIYFHIIGVSQNKSNLLATATRIYTYDVCIADYRIGLVYCCIWRYMLEGNPSRPTFRTIRKPHTL